MTLVFDVVRAKIEGLFPLNLTDEEVLELQSEFIHAYEEEGKPYGDSDEGLIRFIIEGKFTGGEEVKGGNQQDT